MYLNNHFHRFFIFQGHSYRFRIINAGYLNCPIELSIANHTLTAINSDGGDIKPISGMYVNLERIVYGPEIEENLRNK
jgi:Putative multicopper oxidases